MKTVLVNHNALNAAAAAVWCASAVLLGALKIYTEMGSNRLALQIMLCAWQTTRLQPLEGDFFR